MLAINCFFYCLLLGLIALNQPLVATDWLLYSAILLTSAGLIYWVILHQLFKILLFNYHWPVNRAEFFTAVLGLAILAVLWVCLRA